MERGIIIADTKVEFGEKPDALLKNYYLLIDLSGLDEETDEIVLADEVLYVFFQVSCFALFRLTVCIEHQTALVSGQLPFGWAKSSQASISSICETI